MHRPTTIFLLAILGLAACQYRENRPGFPYRIRGTDLVRTDRPDDVVLRGVTFDTCRSAAEVCFPRHLLVAGEGSVGIVVLTANRQDLVVVVDATDPCRVRFSEALTVPMGIRVEVEADGEEIGLVHGKDLYLPPDSPRRLAPRTVRVRPENLVWRDSLGSAVSPEHRDGRFHWQRGDDSRADPASNSCAGSGPFLHSAACR